MWKIIKNKKAFTLSEALITLSIIGVICSLTIPTLYRNHQEQVTVAKVKKFYATLDMAYNAAVLKTGGAKYWGTRPITESRAKKVYEILFEPYFKFDTNCGTNNEGDCLLNNNYLNFHGDQHYNYSNLTSNYKIILKDGSLVWFRGGDTNVPSEFVGVYYDVNGKKPPNRVGVDLFYFRGLNDRIVPFGINDYETSCINIGGYHCTAWIIHKGNMKYLQHKKQT